MNKGVKIVNRFKALFIGLMLLTMSACATAPGGGNLGQRGADVVVNVSAENRDLRICWVAAGAVEVMTDLAQRGGDTRVALGHLVLLQGAIDKARGTDPFWIETDTADVALLFAAVLKDVGRSRLSQILLGGPTVSNFLNVAKRTVVLTVKGRAVMRDINRVLQGVEDGEIQKVDAWRSCEMRTFANRNTLYMISGISSTSFVGPMLAGVAPFGIVDEGWLDEKNWAEGGSDGMIIAGGNQDIVGGDFDWRLVFGGTHDIVVGEGWLDEKQMLDGWPIDLAEYAIISPEPQLAGLDFIWTPGGGNTEWGRHIG